MSDSVDSNLDVQPSRLVKVVPLPQTVSPEGISTSLKNAVTCPHCGREFRTTIDHGTLTCPYCSNLVEI